MAEIAESVEIARRPEEVFSYVTDFSHFPDWQGGVVSARPQGHASVAVGSRALVTRRVGRRALARVEEVTELRPPTAWAVRGVGDGPIVAIARGRIEPLDHGEGSRVTIALEFEGWGIGRLLVPLLLRRQARRQLPMNARKLKEVLERVA